MQWLEQPLVQTVPGSRLSVMEAFEESPLPRCLPRRAVRTWKTGHFSFALESFRPSGVWVLPVEYVVLDFSGRVRCLAHQWIHVLREALDEFHHFLRCGELES